MRRCKRTRKPTHAQCLENAKRNRAQRRQRLFRYQDRDVLLAVRSMTNWQLSQWQRDGAKSGRASYFLGFDRRSRL